MITNTDRVRCKKTECVDYKTELCSPWLCSHYMKKYYDRVKAYERHDMILSLEEELDSTNREWKGLMKAIDIIKKAK